MILRGCSADVVSTLGREFQMEGLLRMPKDDAIEAFMVVKLGEYGKPESCGIHLGNGGQMVGGSGDAEHSPSLHSFASSSSRHYSRMVIPDAAGSVAEHTEFCQSV
jgi:hypothetical protein